VEEFWIFSRSTFLCFAKSGFFVSRFDNTSGATPGVSGLRVAYALARRGRRGEIFQQ